MRSIARLSYLLTIFISCISGSLKAEQSASIPIGMIGPFEAAISSGTSNVRLGNAVMVRIAGRDPSLGFNRVITVLASCDGKWISNEVTNFNFFGMKPEFEELFERAREFEDEFPKTSVHFDEVLESGEAYAKSLAKLAPSLCGTARREPKNLLVPITGVENEDASGSNVFVMTGTSERKGAVINVWTKMRDFETVPYSSENGQSATDSENVPMVRKSTGRSYMELVSYNCRDRTYALLRSATFAATNSLPESEVVPGDQVVYKAPLPGSVGDLKIEAICRIYSRPTK